MRHDEKFDEDTRLRTEDLVTAGETRPADHDDFDSRTDDADALPPPRTADSAEYSLPDHEDRMRDDEAYPDQASDTDRVDTDTDTETDRYDTDADRADPDNTVDTNTETDRYDTDRTDTDTVDTNTETERYDTDIDRADPDNTVDADTHSDTERSDTAEEPVGVGVTDSVPEGARPTADDGDEAPNLFRPEDVDRFRTEWQQVQTMFVDDPREAVQSADHLVAEVMQALASMFNEHKQELEGHWREGTDVQTEDLRIALRRYRSFFYQLLDA